MTRPISYDLQRGRLEVRSPEGWAGRLYDGVLQRADATDLPVAFRVTAAQGAPEAPPPEARVLHKGPGQEGEWIEIFVDGSKTWIIRPDETSLVIDAETASARLVQPGERFSHDSGTLAMHALDFAVTATGQSLVHAACLANPEGTHHALVFAPSGTGKTTTTLGLARAGFAMANDDASVLSPMADGSLGCWGLARNPNVHERTVAMLPWLDGAADWSDRPEVSVPLAVLSDLVPLAPHRLRPIAAVFWLARSSANEAEAVPLAPEEALARLISDNVRHSAAGLGARDLDCLDRLTALVSQVRVFELRVPEGRAGLDSAVGVFGATLKAEAAR